MPIFPRYSLTFIFVVSCFSLTAQKNKDAEGFIITIGNDSLSCTFKQKNWKKQPTQIAVRYNGRDTLFSPDNINGFTISSPPVEFVTRTFRPANYTEKLQDATTARAPELAAPQRSFLRVLYKGNFSLHVYSDKLNKKHFFIEGPGNLVELYSHYYVQAPDPASRHDMPITVLDRSYQFVLKTLMTPCRSLFSIIENIALEEDQLLQVFKLYDRCLESKKEN
jgi:hypothetical protein